MTGRGKRRGPRITAEDHALWDQAMRAATPLRRQGSGPRAEAPEPAAAVAASPFPSVAPTPSSLRARDEAPRCRPAAPAVHPPAPVGRPEPGLDRRTAERLRRGVREPDTRVDLHGMTAARAHARLDAVIRAALRDGHRFVLVITGKGGRRERADDAPWMAPTRGVLREAAPKWLRIGPLARHIVGIYEAHRRHGGEGAFYVYLKKPR